MSKIMDHELHVSEEYSIICDECGMNESTRDGSREMALRSAVAEGFAKLEGSEDILCRHCRAKHGEST